MKTQKLLFVLLICSMSAWTTRAADASTPPAHWYTVVVNRGTSVEEFTGSSLLNTAGLTQVVITNTLPMRLENLRSFYMKDGKSTWHASKTVAAVFIIPRNIIYFYELSEEPKLED